MSEYKSPHNDGHDPYILVWEYGNDIQKAEFTERWAEYEPDTGCTVWCFRLDDGRVVTFRALEWEQRDDVNHLTTIWFRPYGSTIIRKLKDLVNDKSSSEEN